MKKKVHIIFQTTNYDTTTEEENRLAYREYLEINNRDPKQDNDDDFQRWLEDENDFWWSDEKANLNAEIETGILAIADMGLWNGRQRGYKELGTNLNSILYVFPSCDYKKFYTEDGNVRGEGIHHDGTNRVEFRTWKKNISDGAKQSTLNAIFHSSREADNLIRRYTRSIVKDVQKIYGW